MNPIGRTKGAAALSVAKPASLTELKALEGRGMLSFAESPHYRNAKVLEQKKDELPGVVNVTSYVRSPNGAAFVVHSVNGPVGSHSGPGANFSDVRGWLILDDASQSYLLRAGKRTEVKGSRREQLKEVFATGEEPTFRLSNGEKAVAFIGDVYAQGRDGKIVKYSLSNERDPLDV